jgi:hypothetical protein
MLRLCTKNQKTTLESIPIASMTNAIRVPKPVRGSTATSLELCQSLPAARVQGPHNPVRPDCSPERHPRLYAVRAQSGNPGKFLLFASGYRERGAVIRPEGNKLVVRVMWLPEKRLTYLSRMRKHEDENSVLPHRMSEFRFPVSVRA